MINEDDDVPNWIMDDIGVLSQKVVKNVYPFGMECVDWGNLIWMNIVLLAKTLVL